MSIEEEMETFFSDPERKARLMRASEAALEAKIAEEIKWSLPESVSQMCTTFITEEVAPAVHAHLMANKGAIIKGACEAADEIGQQIAIALVAKASKNIANSWNVKKLVEALLD